MAFLTELKDALKGAEERCRIAFDFVEEKDHQVEEYRKTSFQATKTLKALQDEMDDLRRVFHDSLH